MLDKSNEFVGRDLIKEGVITETQLDEAFKIQMKTKEAAESILIKLGYLTEDNIAYSISKRFKLEYIKLEISDIQTAAATNIPYIIAYRYNILPFKIENNNLYIACDRYPGPQIIENLRRLAGRPIIISIATTSNIHDMLDSLYKQNMNSVAEKNPILAMETMPDKESDLEKDVVKIVDDIIKKAIKERATDIHFEIEREKLRVRFRVDGILRERNMFPPDISPPLISRIKVLSNLDIAERRIPQDGGFTFVHSSIGKEIDIRISILPNIWGEKAVLRLLPATKTDMTLESLGMKKDTIRDYLSLIKKPSGLILISGPTGSGKTTTLCSSLSLLNTPEVNVVTVEDPVEYKIGGVTQVQVDRAQKITFAKALRFILRQDPDIIMIGEIRDKETADIALQASLTGHLVLSTIHTNDSASALTRLIDMGCEPFLISSAVTGILAQRLVRINCKFCKKPFSPTQNELRKFNISHLSEDIEWFRGEGCGSCQNTGYKGRTGIFELLKVDKDVRKEIIKESSSDEIRELAISKKMRTLAEDGVLKVKEGMTTPEEILRVVILEDEE